jgi:riboflavin synthase
MFTGLIEALCIVRSVRQSGETMALAVDLGKLTEDCKVGDSIAINGACLTITRLQGTVADFDVSKETLEKSTLGKCTPSSQVNVERAVKAGARLGGHFVSGHIDGTAKITSIKKQGNFAEMKFAADPELIDKMIAKGSVAVDGISLTIADMDKNSFSVAVIPETLKKTTLGNAKTQDKVNIETDIIVKTIKKHLDNILPTQETLTAEKLKQLGF